MKGEHAAVLKHVLLDATRRGWRLFPNNVGTAWAGDVVEDYHYTSQRRKRFKGADVFYEVKRKAVTLANAYFVRYGLCRGSLDAVGWRTVVITPDMVGRRIAQFVAVDAKTPSYDRASEDQKNFIRQVRKAGGYAALGRLVGGEVVYDESPAEESPINMVIAARGAGREIVREEAEV